MKFKFLLVGMLVVFSSVGVFAQDYLRVNLTSVELLKNTWGGSGNAKLKLFMITESSDGGKSQLDIFYENPMSLGLNNKKKIKRAGSSIPVDRNIVNIYIMAVNEEEDSVMARLAIASIGRLSETKAIKFYKKWGTKNFSNWVSSVVSFAGMAVGELTEYTLEEFMEYLDNNKIGMMKIQVNPYETTRNKSIFGSKTAEGNTIKISYSMELREEESDSSSSTSTTQPTSTSKWISQSKTNRVCEKNGGLTIDNYCMGIILEAEQICKALKGKIPDFKDMEEVVTACGGQISNNEALNLNFAFFEIVENREKKNKQNLSYQSCYKQKGFFSINNYIFDAGHNYEAISFEEASLIRNIDRKSNVGIRCVRDGQ